MRAMTIAGLTVAVIIIAIAGGHAQNGNRQTGEKLYIKYGCRSCHAIAGIGGTVGPALDNVKAKGRPLIEKIINNPRELNPSSIMPPFSDRLEPDELTAIVDYLMGL